MKVRTDYVTNSSSSSFILGFNNEEDIQNIASELPSYWSEYAIQSVIDDIKDGVVSKASALDAYAHSIWEGDCNYHGRSYWDMSRAERQSPEYQQYCVEWKRSKVDEFLEKLNKYNVLSVVEYEDHTDFGSEMEHNIMPYMNETIHRISHH